METILVTLAHLVRGMALVLALIVAAAAVLALGGAISDRLDVLTHFAPLYLAGGAVALILHLASRPERGGATLLLAAIAVIASGGLMATETYAAITARRSPAGAQTLKLVQFNLWGRNRDPMGSVRWILQEDPDIVVLEEAYDGAMSAPGALKAHYPYRTTCSHPYICSTMILSKAPPFRLGGLHGKGGETRISGAWIQFGGEKSGFTVVGVHYLRPLPAGLQQQQTRRLGEILDGFDRRSLIVAGDFNSTPWSFSLRRQDARFGLIRRTRALFTWPAAPVSRFSLKFPWPFLAIDHVYAGADWRTVDVRRGPRLGSDHYPVAVTFTRGS